MGLNQGVVEALPPTEAGQGRGGLLNRNCPGLVVAVAAVVVGGDEEEVAHSHFLQEEGEAHNKRAADCSNQDEGAGSLTAVVEDGDVGTGKGRVDQQEDVAEALHRSSLGVADRCREAGTGLDTGLPPRASDAGPVREVGVAADEDAEEEECQGS